MKGLKMNKQAEFKKDWIFKTIDKAHDQGLIVSPDMIVSEFNIPSADALIILNEWFCDRLASLIQGASNE
jgi:hypothetical protein